MTVVGAAAGTSAVPGHGAPAARFNVLCSALLRSVGLTSSRLLLRLQLKDNRNICGSGACGKETSALPCSPRRQDTPMGSLEDQKSLCVCAVGERQRPE